MSSRVKLHPISFVILATLGGCASVPSGDPSWLASNCPRPDPFEADRCAQWSNCQSTEHPTVCACTHPDIGKYFGELKNGQKHGWGRYEWNTGQVYVGFWGNDQKTCGVERSSGEYIVFKDGVIAERGNPNANTDAFLGALFVGALTYAVVESGGASGYRPLSDREWDWDYQPGNAQWVCRGVQTGQYANLENCKHQVMDDNRWP